MTDDDKNGQIASFILDITKQRLDKEDGVWRYIARKGKKEDLRQLFEISDFVILKEGVNWFDVLHKNILTHAYEKLKDSMDLTKLLSQQIADEIDREILEMLEQTLKTK